MLKGNGGLCSQLTNTFDFSVKDEKARTNELQKQLAFVDNLLTIESRLSKELLFKSQNCMNLLYKKRDKVA